MDGENIINKVDAIEKNVSSTSKVEKEAFNQETADQFAQSMEKVSQESTQTAEVKPVEATDKPNPMEVARDQMVDRGQDPTALHKIEQTTTKINDQIAEISKAIEGGDVKLKHSYQALLENKLSHIDENLQIALEKAGVEYTPPSDLGAQEKLPGALEKFLGFLTRSQGHLDNVASELRHVTNQKDDGGVNPADLMAVQIKVQFVQQELELFTNLLNKGLESTKTLMNVQV